MRITQTGFHHLRFFQVRGSFRLFTVCSEYLQCSILIYRIQQLLNAGVSDVMGLK